MGFLDDVGSFLGDLTGQTQSKKGYQAYGAGTGVLNSIEQKTPIKFAQESGQAGQALGNQMGQQAAQLGTQQAMQAARTAGLNKGQAALIGGQQAGQLFTRGQMEGQGLGMNAYGQGAGQQTAAAEGETQAGLAMKGLGAGAGQNVASGIAGLAGGASSMLSGGGGAMGGIGSSSPLGAAGGAMPYIPMAKGGVTNKPAVVAEDGKPEAVLPLSDKERTAQILEKLGFKKGAQEARSMKCPTCGQEMKGKANGTH